MSMPSSRLLVATSAGSRPAFSSSSMIVRCSRARLPWWARATSSSASSLRRRARRSASRRLLTKISVERWARISSSSSGYMAGQIDRRRFSPPGDVAGSSGAERSPPSSRMSSTGHDDLDLELLGRARRRRSVHRTGAPLARPGRPGSARSRPAGAGWPTGRCAAGRRRPRPPPARAAPGSATGGRRAWSRPRRGSRRRSPSGCRRSICVPREVSSRYRLSGVVIRMSGGVRSIRWRSRWGVSPVRTATEISGTSTPMPARRPPRSRPAGRAGCARRRSSGP